MLSIENPKWRDVPVLLHECLRVLYRIERHHRNAAREVGKAINHAPSSLKRREPEMTEPRRLGDPRNV